MNRLKSTCLSCAALVLAAVSPGCMTSRGVCTVTAPGEVKRPVTVNRYRLTQIQQRLPDGRTVILHTNPRMREMLDDPFDRAELCSYVPGMWSTDGIPVTVTFTDWRNDNPVNWTILPCILTLGICPYCHHEDISSRVEISRDDGKGTASFSYRESDDWKMSMLFELGYVSYSEISPARNEFQLCGRGDILTKPHLAGLAHGIAAALADLESKSGERPNTTKGMQK